MECVQTSETTILIRQAIPKNFMATWQGYWRRLWAYVNVSSLIAWLHEECMDAYTGFCYKFTIGNLQPIPRRFGFLNHSTITHAKKHQLKEIALSLVCQLLRRLCCGSFLEMTLLWLRAQDTVRSPYGVQAYSGEGTFWSNTYPESTARPRSFTLVL